MIKIKNIKVLLKLLTALFLLFYANVSSQDIAIHHNFHNQASRFKITWPDKKPPLCPWQSLRLLPYTHIQMDVIGPKKHIQAIDLCVVERDLWRFFKGRGLSSMEMVDRGYDVTFHTSYPYDFSTTKWQYDPNVAYDPDNCPSPGTCCPTASSMRKNNWMRIYFRLALSDS